MPQLADCTTLAGTSFSLAVKVFDWIHANSVRPRRVNVLASALAPLLPANISILDIGCGDAHLTGRIAEVAKAASISGIDILVRPQTDLPVSAFDGVHIPFADQSFDAVMMIDVLHHSDDPLRLLREAARVSRRLILLKDHISDGLFANQTLRIMDWIGNYRHGVVLPYNYWSRARWLKAFEELHLQILNWTSDVPLYPFPFSLIFGRSLHFIARLEVGSAGSRKS